MGAMIFYYGMLPAVLALGVRSALGHAITRVDQNGVCLQTTGYTCGPAAAVTCLRALGEAAEEGSVARAAHCSPSFGTDGRVLARTLEGLYRGLHCRYGYFDSLEALSLPAVADCQITGIGGHYVAVLALEKEYVIVGDPLCGRVRLSREQFLAEWKGTAIVFAR